MVKHIILWQLKDELSDVQKSKVISDIKIKLEALTGVIDGLLEIKVETDKLDSSNADLMLYSAFCDEDAYKGYIVHPEHIAIADNYVRPFVKTRLCLDFNA